MKFLPLAVISALFAGSLVSAQAETKLMNVSYDPTRELYRDINAAFAKSYKTEAGEDVRVTMTHGGSSAQARTVIDGLEADVVTLALAYDIDAIADARGIVAKDWQSRLPSDSSPYTSTIVLLVRKGNPKGIKDWGDLVKPGIQVITPNPKTSGGARWNFLAAWAWAEDAYGRDDAKVLDYMTKLFKNVPVLDTGARGSTTTFVKRGLGDVLLSWENEAYLAQKELGPDEFEIVIPSLSILAQPPVAVVDANVDKHGTRKVAEDYLKFLYSPEGQRIAAKHYYRPLHPEQADADDRARFADLKLITLAERFGDWRSVQKRFFADGAVFDQIYSKR